MEEEDGDASTPFWLQSRRNNTYFRRTASLGSRATTVATQVFFVGAAAILIVFFIIPPFFSSVSQIFRPHLVRKSWDYLNFVLVLFAVICGFLSRNTGNDETDHNKEDTSKNTEAISGYGYNKFSSSPSIMDRGHVSNSATPRYWIDDRGGDRYPDQTVYKRFSRLRSSSYPDLRLREFEVDERWRFYDDTRVSECRYEVSDPIYPNQGFRNWQEVKPPEDVHRTKDGGDVGGEGKGLTGGSDPEKVEVVVKAADGVVQELTTPSNPPSPPSPPPSPPRAPPPPKPAKRKATRVYQDVASKVEKKERADFVEATTPMSPIPPPTTAYQSKKQDKKKGGATKDFLIALRRKKKKQRQQSIDGLDLLFGSDPLSSYSMPPKSPPHPPPPPPPPFFQGLFSSKKGKSKRTYSNPPPPPPPPPERRFESRASISKIRKAPVESRTSKPNPPSKVTQFIGTGSESPLLPIPPPPPPPPFKMPAWKFVKRGDYVRMASNISISSDEPDDDPDAAQSADNKAAGSQFCPSPDVDTKADDFIARFRAGLKLEKMNSVKRGRSNLGPEPELDESGS